MRLFLFFVFTGVWTGVAKLVDHFTHSFGLAFILGAAAAVFVLVAVSCCKAAALANRAGIRP